MGSPALDHAGAYGAQLVKRHRFGENPDTLGDATARFDFGGVESADDDNIHALAVRRGGETVNQLIPVKAGHRQIGDHQIRGIAADANQAVDAVAGGEGVDRQIPVADHGLVQLQQIVVVFHHQYF